MLEASLDRVRRRHPRRHHHGRLAADGVTDGRRSHCCRPPRPSQLAPDCTSAASTSCVRSRAADASSGFTECGPIEVDADGVRTATASWHTRGHGVNFQPVSAFPEPGLMSWNDDATVMMERAPSGAYVEEWRLVPGSRDPTLASRRSTTRRLYRAGPVAVLRPRSPRSDPAAGTLARVARRATQGDRPMIEALLDCEFSVAELRRRHVDDHRVDVAVAGRQGARCRC